MTRDANHDKPAFGAYLCPLVQKRFGEYMLKHEIQIDGRRRRPDNWKLGQDRQQWLESLLRHVHDLHLHQDGWGADAREGVEEACCGILFNAAGYLREVLKAGTK